MPSLSRRQTLAATLAVALTPAALLPTSAGAQQAREVVEMTMGSPDAPVTLIEYAMFNCPHCAEFNETMFPRIKQDYIDTGKVRLIFREVYFNRPSLWAGMIARCAPQDRYFGLVDVLFDTQESWALESDPQALMGKLYGIGRQAGLSDAEIDACMQDRAFAEALVAEYQKNAAADGIEATPTFVINGETQRDLPWDQLPAKLDEALGS
jgi:protein-disulfide isomerase